MYEGRAYSPEGDRSHLTLYLLLLMLAGIVIVLLLSTPSTVAEKTPLTVNSPREGHMTNDPTST